MHYVRSYRITCWVNSSLGALPCATTNDDHQMNGTLPSDVHRCIIDLLQGDKLTLSNSSLVAKSWLSPCRSHLFSTVRVYAYDPVSDTADTDNFDEFLAHSTQICGHIRSLELSARRECREEVEETDADETDPDVKSEDALSDSSSMDSDAFDFNPPLVLSTCFAIISKLPNLQTLKVHHVRIEREEYRMTPFNPPNELPSVFNLGLSYLCIEYDSPTSYWDLIRPFCNLTHLKMTSLERLQDIDHSRVPEPFPGLSLQKLTIHTSDKGAFLQTLLDRQCLHCLDSLTTDSGWLNTSHIVNNVLKQHGRQLMELSLSPFGRTSIISSHSMSVVVILYTIGHPERAIHVGLCTQLRSIIFNVSTSIHRPGSTNTDTWNSVIDSIFEVRSRLQKVFINFELYGETKAVIKEIERAVDWERLGLALESQRSIIGVVMCFSDITRHKKPLVGEELQEAKELVARRLGSLLREGLLQFDDI